MRRFSVREDNVITQPTLTSAVVSRKTAVVLLGVVILIWGSNWPIMKIAMAEQLIGPFTFAFVRVAMSAVLMFLVAGIAGQLRFPSVWYRSKWPNGRREHTAGRN